MRRPFWYILTPLLTVTVVGGLLTTVFSPATLAAPSAQDDPTPTREVGATATPGNTAPIATMPPPTSTPEVSGAFDPGDSPIVTPGMQAPVANETEEPGENLGTSLPLTENVRYEVGVSDTLDDIAATFDIALDCLRTSNELEPNASLIFPGDILLISVNCPPYTGLNYVPFPRPIEQGGGETGTYTVRAGDTLSDIAVAFNISEVSLAEANSIENAGTIFIGQVLTIPAGAPEYGRVPPLNMGEQGGGDSGELTYVIQPGDTLDVIGAFYNAAPLCIAEANNIPNAGRITPRMTIVIPESCAPYVGANLAGGRVLPADNTAEETTSPTVVEATPTPTVEATQPPVQQMDPTPTPEMGSAGASTEMAPIGNIIEALIQLDQDIEGDGE